MKRLAVLPVFFCIFSYVFAQIELQDMFNFQLQNNENLLNIQLFDYSANNIEDICVTVKNDSICFIKIYNQIGELLDSLNIQTNNLTNPILYCKSHIFSIEDSIFICSLIANNGSFCFQIYDD
ncbi:MAG: hypothetical protein PF570_01040, partial [Candidatus Cloacimonetes bacterium]|nr:hypothetical protein [Candidatus Cloacimonadota bacterium]